jgi:two-component system, NarL family, response regulator DegU
MDAIRIVIADDHPIFRSGLKEVLTQVTEIVLVGEAADGIAAYQLILAERPNVAILDIDMPLLSGLDVAQKVLAEKTYTQIIILTMHREPMYLRRALDSGVMGYLIKDNAAQDLVQCVRAVAAGKAYICDAMQQYAQNYGDTLLSPEMDKVNQLLSPTEKVILQLIRAGKTSSEIAAMLFISPNTVDNHRGNMTRKLSLEGKNALLKFAMLLQGE